MTNSSGAVRIATGLDKLHIMAASHVCLDAHVATNYHVRIDGMTQVDMIHSRLAHRYRHRHHAAAAVGGPHSSGDAGGQQPHEEPAERHGLDVRGEGRHGVAGEGWVVGG